MGLPEHVEAITKVGEIAGKEFSIEQALDKMEEEWDPMLLDISPYKETGTCIMKSGEESAQQLDDHIVMTQAMSFSPYKKPFESRIISWENKLRTTQVSLQMIFVIRTVSIIPLGAQVFGYTHHTPVPQRGPNNWGSTVSVWFIPSVLST